MSESLNLFTHVQALQKIAMEKSYQQIGVVVDRKNEFYTDSEKMLEIVSVVSELQAINKSILRVACRIASL